MPTDKLSMRKCTEVLRLRFEPGLSQGQIARSCSSSQESVSNCLKRARTAGIIWPLQGGWDEAGLEDPLVAHSLGRYGSCRPRLDVARPYQELQSHCHVTLELLWEEYCREHPEGYG